MSGPGGPGLESAEDLEQIVLGVSGQGIAARVNADARAPRDVVVEPDVGRLRLVELHVPVAVGRYLLVQTLAQGHLGERRAVRRERPGRERSATCFFFQQNAGIQFFAVFLPERGFLKRIKDLKNGSRAFQQAYDSFFF